MDAFRFATVEVGFIGNVAVAGVGGWDWRAGVGMLGGREKVVS